MTRTIPTEWTLVNHDFGATLQHLRAGRCARREPWPPNYFIAHQYDERGQERIWLYTHPDNVRTRVTWSMQMVDVLAYDWQLDERPFKHPTNPPETNH